MSLSDLELNCWAVRKWSIGSCGRRMYKAGSCSESKLLQIGGIWWSKAKKWKRSVRIETSTDQPIRWKVTLFFGCLIQSIQSVHLRLICGPIRYIIRPACLLPACIRFLAVRDGQKLFLVDVLAPFRVRFLFWIEAVESIYKINMYNIYMYCTKTPTSVPTPCWCTTLSPDGQELSKPR